MPVVSREITESRHRKKAQVQYRRQNVPFNRYIHIYHWANKDRKHGVRACMIYIKAYREKTSVVHVGTTALVYSRGAWYLAHFKNAMGVTEPDVEIARVIDNRQNNKL